jgi:hypothetical protein
VAVIVTTSGGASWVPVALTVICRVSIVIPIPNHATLIDVAHGGMGRTILRPIAVALCGHYQIALIARWRVVNPLQDQHRV